MFSAHQNRVWEFLGSARAQLVLKFFRAVSLAHTWHGNNSCVGCIGRQICIAVSMIFSDSAKDGPCDSKSHAGVRYNFGCFRHRHHISLYPSSFGRIKKSLPDSVKIVSVDFLNGWKEIISLCHLYRWMPFVCCGNASILSTRALVDYGYLLDVSVTLLSIAFPTRVKIFINSCVVSTLSWNTLCEYSVLGNKKLNIYLCSNLNDSNHHGLLCLNTWSPVGETVWEGLIGGHCLRLWGFKRPCPTQGVLACVSCL